MTYRSFMEQVMKLPFIKDEVMAVLGLLASKMGTEPARRFTDLLPSQFNFGALLGHQHTPTEASADEMISTIATQFNLRWQEASDLVVRVIHCVKEWPQGASFLREVSADLPPDWADLIDGA